MAAKTTSFKSGKKEKLSSRISKNKSYILMLLPFLALFTFFTIIPILMSIPISLTNFNMVKFPVFVGFDNFKRLFLDDEVFLIAVKNTLILSFITGPIGYFLCLLLAWFINNFKSGMRTLFTFMFYMPSVCGVLMIAVFQYFFSGDMYGFFNGIFIKFGFISDPIQWLTDPAYNMGVVIVVQLWISMGAGFLAFIAGLQSIDKSMYEAGAIEGIRNRWQELFHITLPLMGPQLLFGAVMQISATFSAGAISMQLTGFPSTDNSTVTLVSHALDYGNIRYEMGFSAAVFVVLFLAMMIANGIIQRGLRKFTA